MVAWPNIERRLSGFFHFATTTAVNVVVMSNWRGFTVSGEQCFPFFLTLEGFTSKECKGIDAPDPPLTDA
jgi:hypothetical protein